MHQSRMTHPFLFLGKRFITNITGVGNFKRRTESCVAGSADILKYMRASEADNAGKWKNVLFFSFHVK